MPATLTPAVTSVASLTETGSALVGYYPSSPICYPGLAYPAQVENAPLSDGSNPSPATLTAA